MHPESKVPMTPRATFLFGIVAWVEFREKGEEHEGRSTTFMH